MPPRSRIRIDDTSSESAADRGRATCDRACDRRKIACVEGDKAIEIFLKHRLHERKILLYSGRDPSEIEKLARACGASGFVHKTVTDAALADAIRAHLDG